MDGVLRQRRTRRTLGRSETALSPQRSHYTWLASGEAAGGVGLVSFILTLGLDLGRDGEGGRPRCERRVAYRFWRQPIDDGGVDQAALPRSCQASRDRCFAMSCRRIS